MATFHDKLQEYLDRSGMKQSALAKQSGLSKNYLSLIVNGHRKPPRVEAVLKMVEALNLKPEEAEEFVELAGYSPKMLATATRNRTFPWTPEDASSENKRNQNKTVSQTQQKASTTEMGTRAAGGVFAAPLSLESTTEQDARNRIMEDPEIQQMLEEAGLPYLEEVKAQQMIWELSRELSREAARTIIRMLKEELEK